MAIIIYTGAFRFPDGDAAAARVLGIGKALRSAGYDIKFAGWEEHEREQDLQEKGHYEFQGFVYKSQKDLRCQHLSPIKRLIRYVFAGKNTLNWLKSEDLSNVKTIIAYHGGSIFLIRLALFCKLHGLKLLIDCTEWYAPHHLVGGRYGLVWLDNEIRMRFINSCIGRIITISSFLEKYYAKKGCNVLRIPPLVDLADTKWPVLVNAEIYSITTLRLVYAGIPAKKDLLGNALRGLIILKDEGLVVELHLIGPSRKDVVECLDGECSVLDELGTTIVFHGRISQSNVPSVLDVFDFSVLLRPIELYAQAGFSTKLVESLASGLPVITNKTGDIAEFVHDGIEGILLVDYSPSAFAFGVRRALALSKMQRINMRKNARLRAEMSFDYRRYIDDIGSFIQK